VRRGLKSEYFILTDPLIILAGAVLLDCLRDLGYREWVYPVAAVLFVLQMVVGQADSVKHAHAAGTGIDLRVEPVLPAAAAAAMVSASCRPVITAC
jgi:hypothetical protein